MQFIVPRFISSLITVLFLFLFVTCFSQQAEAAILWSASHESGTMTEWSQGSCGGEFNSGNGISSASQQIAHTGQYAAKMTINATGSDTGVRLFRWCEPRGTNDSLYYSSWLYFPTRVTVTGGWWNIFQFKSKYATGNDPYWLLDVHNRADGSMFLSLYDWIHEQGYNQNLKNIPVGQWVNLEVFLKRSTTTTGQVIVWQDGVQIYNISNVATLLPDSELHWSVNNYSNTLSPSLVTIYADDAAISTTQLSNQVAPTATPPIPTLTTIPPTAAITVKLHGIGSAGDSLFPGSAGNYSPLSPQKNLTISFYNENNINVLGKTVPISFESSTGVFKGVVPLDGLPIGYYTVRVYVQQYLARVLPGIFQMTQGTAFTLPTVWLIAGDATYDNTLNILDYNMIIDCYADAGLPRACSDLLKKQAADIDNDGKVNQFDYNLLIRELSVRSGA